MFSMVSTLNETVLYMGKLRREWILKVITRKKITSVCGDGW